MSTVETATLISPRRRWWKVGTLEIVTEDTPTAPGRGHALILASAWLLGGQQAVRAVMVQRWGLVIYYE